MELWTRFKPALLEQLFLFYNDDNSYFEDNINKRNRLKNKQNVNSSITKLNFNFINGNALSPVKKKEEEVQL